MVLPSADNSNEATTMVVNEEEEEGITAAVATTTAVEVMGSDEEEPLDEAEAAVTTTAAAVMEEGRNSREMVAADSPCNLDTSEETADALQDNISNNETGYCDLITTNNVVLVIDDEDDDEGLGDSSRSRSTQTATATASATFARLDDDDDPLAAVESGTEASTAAAAAATVTTTTTRAEFVSVTVIKKTPEDRLGIAFAGRGGGDEENNNHLHGMRIVALHKDGMLHSSPLRVGDQILSIAGKSCFELDTPTAGALLRQARGIVSIVVRNPMGGKANYVETMVEKADPSSPVGLAMRRNSYGSLEVSKVIASGLFAHSLLNVGDRVIAINNIPCCPGLTAQEAVDDMIRSSPRFVTILTETQGASGVVVASAEQGEELAIATAAAAVEASSQQQQQQQQQLQAIVPKVEPWEYIQHPCYCIWMLIISLSIIGLAILQPFK